MLEEADQLPEEECVASSLVPALEEGHDIISQSFFFFGFCSDLINQERFFELKAFILKTYASQQAFQEKASRGFFSSFSS